MDKNKRMELITVPLHCSMVIELKEMNTEWNTQNTEQKNGRKKLINYL